MSTERIKCLIIALGICIEILSGNSSARKHLCVICNVLLCNNQNEFVMLRAGASVNIGVFRNIFRSNQYNEIDPNEQLYKLKFNLLIN